MARQFQQRFAAAFNQFEVGKETILMRNARELFPAVMRNRRTQPFAGYNFRSQLRSSTLVVNT